jgi:hypothetical protein
MNVQIQAENHQVESAETGISADSSASAEER